MPILRIEEVRKNYQLGKTVVPALQGVSFSVDQGEFLSVVGPSGCGKTTLLNMIGAIDTPTSGRILFHGKDIASFSDNQEAETRLKSFGFIFQSFNLIPVLNVFENIELPMVLAHVPKAERARRVFELVRAVGLEDHVKHRSDELSGGQRQRVAVARALVNRPEIVIADEPTANLDSETGIQVIELMSRLNTREGVTFIFSTHHEGITSRVGRIIRLMDGKIISDERMNRT